MGGIVGNYGYDIGCRNRPGYLNAQFIIVLTDGTHHQVLHIIVDQIIDDNVKIVFQHTGTQFGKAFDLAHRLVTGFIGYPDANA